MRKLIIAAVMLQILTVGKLMAQVDPHFSQYYAYPLWLNPALTGVIDGDLRVSVNARDQWASISNGYKTGGLSLDFRPTDKVGIGFNIINQAAGTAGYNYFAGYGSFGYGVAVSSDGLQRLHFGVQAGFINRGFNPASLQFDNQYNNATGFDPTLPSFENFTNTNATVFDAAAGIFYYDGNPEKNANLFAGISLAHLTNTNDPFAYDGINSRLPMRFTIHGGVKIHASSLIDITPHAIFINQQSNQIAAFGLYSELKMPENNGLILGAMYRVNDASVADVGYHLNNMVIGLSYDFNNSSLHPATGGQGGFELSISYVFRKRLANPAEICPRF